MLIQQGVVTRVSVASCREVGRIRAKGTIQEALVLRGLTHPRLFWTAPTARIQAIPTDVLTGLSLVRLLVLSENPFASDKYTRVGR